VEGGADVGEREETVVSAVGWLLRSGEAGSVSGDGVDVAGEKEVRNGFVYGKSAEGQIGHFAAEDLVDAGEGAIELGEVAGGGGDLLVVAGGLGGG